ncbi:conserved exported protein of unknown function [Tenacibaculum sp. 190524A02b]|uniref:head GIN domain-containing protein n=1 Tax=Tenacibaculum vairaonense TaxID=3137860 RepID=UPI0032B1E7C5
MNITKQLFAFFLLTIVLTTFTSCSNEDCINGSGEQKSKTITLSPFTRIFSYNKSNITIVQGDEFKVEVDGDANIVDEYLSFNVVKDACYIKLESNCFNDYNLNIRLTLPTLKDVRSYGSDKIRIENFKEQSALYLELVGSGDIILNEFKGVEELRSSITGSGSIRLNKQLKIENTSISIVGSGDYKGYNALTKNCNVSIPGSGICEVSVSSKLKVSIPGSGRVYYKGTPEISFSNPGSGALINAN